MPSKSIVSLAFQVLNIEKRRGNEVKHLLNLLFPFIFNICIMNLNGINEYDSIFHNIWVRLVKGKLAGLLAGAAQDLLNSLENRALPMNISSETVF